MATTDHGAQTKPEGAQIRCAISADLSALLDLYTHLAPDEAPPNFDNAEGLKRNPWL